MSKTTALISDMQDFRYGFGLIGTEHESRVGQKIGSRESLPARFRVATMQLRGDQADLSVRIEVSPNQVQRPPFGVKAVQPNPRRPVEQRRFPLVLTFYRKR